MYALNFWRELDHMPLYSTSFIERCSVTLLQVHVHLKRHLMKELPEAEDDVAQWCRDIFVAKVCNIQLVLLGAALFCYCNYIYI